MFAWNQRMGRLTVVKQGRDGEMRDRRRAATVCERCGRQIDQAIGACIECSRVAGIAFTRRTDPAELRPPRYGPRKIERNS